ncbi:hypothetical protein D3C78_1507370 [compost metagenome]
MPLVSTKRQPQRGIDGFQLHRVAFQTHHRRCQRLGAACQRSIEQFHSVATDTGKTLLMVDRVKNASAIKIVSLDNIVVQAPRQTR